MIEQFITDHYQLISVVFGLHAAGFVAFRVVLSFLAVYRKRIETEQRHEFQAGYFDVQEKRQDTMLKLLLQLNGISQNNVDNHHHQ